MACLPVATHRPDHIPAILVAVRDHGSPANSWSLVDSPNVSGNQFSAWSFLNSRSENGIFTYNPLAEMDKKFYVEGQLP